MKFLTNKRQISYENAKTCYTRNENFEDKPAKDRKFYTVRNHCYYRGEYRGSVHTICNLKYRISTYILKVFNNGSNYDYYFIIKALVQEFDGQFTWLGGNSEKCITFLVPIEK